MLSKRPASSKIFPEPCCPLVITRAYLACLVAGLMAGCPLPGKSTPQTPAAEWSVESGVIWQVGNLTPLSYTLVPTQFSWRSGEFRGRDLKDGARLVLRHRITLFATSIVTGPESHYLAIAASPSLEWWNAARTRSWYFGAGGGAGVIDSRGVTGGQGQDFTLNWFIRAGAEWSVARNGRVFGGILFQHLSNGGQTDPNPGIDALGFTFGFSRRL